MAKGRISVVTFSQEWHALAREAQLAGQQIATGVTALGRANQAQTGYYTQAFFGLSIGLERLGKLIVLADYAIDNSGRFLTDAELKKIGHNIATLLDTCEVLSVKYRAGKKHAERPNDTIHQGAVKTLTEFGRLSRYYDLDLIVQGKSAALTEPIEAWWKSVVQPILSKHYSKRQQEKDKLNATALAKLIGDSSYVLHQNEEGRTIDSIEALALRTGLTSVAQKYGRLYTLQIVRWLVFLLSDLSHIGAYERRIEPLLGLSEPFVVFMNEDNLLLSRKTWSVYPPY